MKKYTSFFDTHPIYESIKWEYKIRDGKKVRKPVSSNPEDMRIEYKNDRPHEVRKSGAEKKKMSIQNKKTARKTKSKQTTSARKRKKSMSKRIWGDR